MLASFGESAGSEANEKALDRLVRNLHGESNPDFTTYNVFTDFRAFYPFIGGTAFAHSKNLIDYSLFDLSFNGSPSHSSTGMITSGIAQDADTGYNPFTEAAVGNYSVGMYNRVKLSGSGNPWIFGAFDGSNLTGIRVQSVNISTGIGVNRFIDGISELVGKHIVVEVEGTTTGRLISNGAVVNTWSAGATKPNDNIRISSVGGAAYADIDVQSFWIAEKIFSSAEHLAIHNSIVQYQDGLLRL